MSQEVSIQSLGKRQRLFEWSQRVAECRQSGMSVTRWCQEHSITPKTYYMWQKRVFAFMVEQQKQQLTDEEQEPCFAELPAPSVHTPLQESSKTADDGASTPHEWCSRF